MPSIINGLFSGRSGIGSHGQAIAVVSDNISNASTVGFKTSRAEFQDLIAGGQTSGKVIGSGSSISAVSNIFEQGTLEFSGRALDMAIDGNGLFVLASGQQHFYTRAGNFRVDNSGYLVNQNGYYVLGFPSNGNGSLQPININSVSQNSVGTTSVAVSGNVDASADITPLASIPAVSNAGAGAPYSATTYSQLNNVAQFSTVVDVFDKQGGKHTITFFFFHTAANTYVARGYVNSEDVDPTGNATGIPRFIGGVTMNFGGDGSRTNAPAAGAVDFTAAIPWNTGASASSIGIKFDPFTQYASNPNILSITQDGKGIGTVGSVSIEKNGDIFALLDNGQAAVIGTVGLCNFTNPEGLVRIGGTLLQQSPNSGEPVIGKPETGAFGSVQSGSLELSTVDMASEFVKLITLQRGFQANSRIITTINQLLNEIIQLV